MTLRQIGLAFFEKIATDRAIAGETQDFYQELLARLDRAVKLIEEESGVQTLSFLEAKIVTFINEDDSSQQPLSWSSVEGDCKLSISRLPVRYISQLRQIGRETDCEPDIEDCVCIGETQDFYHGCLAAIDFALSLAGEKYAYAQISLVKTNAANFIELNKDWEPRVLELKGLSSSNRHDRQPKQNLLVELSQVDGDNQVGTLSSEGEGDEAALLSTKTGTLEGEVQKQDLKSDRPDSSKLTIPLVLSNVAILKYQIETEEGVREQFKEEVVKLREEKRLELENLLSRTLLDGCQQLKLGKRKVIEHLTDLYDLTVGESEGVSVSSRTVSVRGQLIKVRAENWILAQVFYFNILNLSSGYIAARSDRGEE